MTALPKILTAVFVVVASTLSPVWASCVKPGSSLPPVNLDPAEKSGRIVYLKDKQKLEYQAWSSSNLNGKPYVLYHLAARHGVDKLNDGFVRSLDSLPSQNFRLVVLLNIDDVFVGGRYFARKTFEQNAAENNDNVTFILDNSSTIRDQWCIKKKSSTVIIVNDQGVVTRAKDGKLSEVEVSEYLKLVDQLAASGKKQKI